MKTIIRLIAAAVLSSSPALAGAGDASSDLIQMGAYVASDNMKESEEFYRALLGREPIMQLESFVAFDVAGGIFAIVKRDVYAPNASPGTGAVPYIHSANLTAVQSRMEKATGGAAPEIIKEPGIHLLKVSDPSGQLIEFFSLVGES